MGRVVNTVLSDDGVERILCRQVFETYMRERDWDVTPLTDAHQDGIPVYSYKIRETNDQWLWWQAGWMERAKL